MTQQEIAARLTAAGIENAAWEARLLCEHLSGEALIQAVARRCEHYPLQYILGEWYFYRECYEVSEDCLIPRSDTEILVDAAIKILPNGARFLDLCTGSGCVAISTLAGRTDTVATAVDLFPKTLALAKRNASKNGVGARVDFICHDVLTPPPASLERSGFDAILSNPPYIQNDIVPTLQREVGFEPSAALMGGADGLDFYRAILEKWCVLLKPQGLLILEIGYDQGKALTDLAAAHGYSCVIKKDFSGNDRIVILQK
ncbi:MAG: peptide chain release factor N(5)-glutamine methyltransferase [Clostridia bacterium]|nr:peptide chain release factor N(5)-glutamine methyltransferase [Clostridia bacterium]